jgi:O-methyltransferase
MEQTEDVEKKIERLTYLTRCRVMYMKARDEAIDNYHDYFRISSLDLMASKIKEEKIPGACAELGVFQGEFARFINKYFPAKKLYLFDTFEGFDSRDEKIDDKNNFRLKKHDFSNTSVDLVLSKMPYPDNVIIKKGYFPNSVRGGGGGGNINSVLCLLTRIYIIPFTKG